jgi:hypothetical protein
MSGKSWQRTRATSEYHGWDEQEQTFSSSGKLNEEVSFMTADE